MDELKPCPFCGSEPDSQDDDGRVTIWCSNVHCEAAQFSVSAWNTRPLEEDKDAEIARLKGEVEKLQADHLWIPVTERLPDTSRDVQYGRVYNNGWFLSGVSQYLIDHGSHAWRGVDPTHWREILPPTKA